VTNILEVTDLNTSFHTRAGRIPAVRGVTFAIGRGSTLALVGESGSGKSVTSLSIMRLVPPPGEIESGTVVFDGQDLLQLDPEQMRRLRGNKIAMIFQDPMTSLNPVYTVGHQIAEPIQLHKHLSYKRAWAASIEMMELVKIPDAARRARDYPFQLSGGMRQRVMIAMALSCRPTLLIADEPTTALDVTIQAEILDLLRSLKQEFDLSMLLITHDLGVVAETADSVAVMYAGEIVEQAPVRDLFRRSRHPYTEGLLRSVPRLTEAGIKQKRLRTIEGTVPSLLHLQKGCQFAPRCEYVIAECTQQPIALLEVDQTRLARCLRADCVGDESAKTRHFTDGLGPPAPLSTTPDDQPRI
jgi:oligopeptide/dipeptide ABC transporter ATP-binding protein